MESHPEIKMQEVSSVKTIQINLIAIRLQLKSKNQRQIQTATRLSNMQMELSKMMRS